jgi:hypothetical protein
LSGPSAPADESHGLVGGDGQVEEERGLLERVGAVGYHDAIHRSVLDQLVDPPTQLEPDLVVHVLAADAGDLLARDLGDLAQLGHSVDEDVDRQLARHVARLARLLLFTGNRAAGREDDDLWQLGGTGRPDEEPRRKDERQHPPPCLIQANAHRSSPP